MRSHPNQGARIVEPFTFMGEAVEIVRCHHERFDGEGYPMGLRGEDIPLAARIFSVADSFDAMTSDRPYRSALSSTRPSRRSRRRRPTVRPALLEAFGGLAARRTFSFFPRRRTPSFATG